MTELLRLMSAGTVESFCSSASTLSKLHSCPILTCTKHISHDLLIPTFIAH